MKKTILEIIRYSTLAMGLYGIAHLSMYLLKLTRITEALGIGAQLTYIASMAVIIGLAYLTEITIKEIIDNKEV